MAMAMVKASTATSLSLLAKEEGSNYTSRSNSVFLRAIARFKMKMKESIMAEI